jgi:putative DNA primase/helicase
MSELPPDDREEWLRQVRERLAREEANKHKGNANGSTDPHRADREETLRELRIDIGQLNCESPPEHIAAIVDRIAASAPDEITRETLLKTVKAQTKTSVRSLRKQLDYAARTARKKTNRQDWRDSLSRNKDGEPFATAANVLIALRNAPEWKGVLALNEFNQRPMLVGKPPWATEWKKPRPFSDADEARTLVWMQENGLTLCRIEAVRQALAIAIDDNRFHPVRNYLDSQKWDGQPRLDKWLTFYLGVNAIENYTGLVGRCWMISAVARIYEPGCTAKYCLLLEGDQDLGKSTALEVLGGEWYTDDIAELGTKDSAMQAGNPWIVELSELDSVRKAHIAAVKAFISRKVDRFRKPFGRNIIDQERQCVMAGSINPGTEYFVDETGNVRFWPVFCVSIDIAALRRDRDQLWAEAVHRYKSGEKWWLEDEAAIEAAKEEQDARTHVDSWTSTVQKYLDEHPSITAVTTGQILKSALFIDTKDHDKARQSRVGIIMRRHIKWRGRKSGSRRWFEHPGKNDTECPGE